jgi:hypothetical protein
VRGHTRLRWWAQTWGTLADVVTIDEHTKNATDDGPYPLETLQVPLGELPGWEPYDGTPVAYGHYWRHWDTSRPDWQPQRDIDWTERTACVDFSVGKGGPLVAYRWHDGDTGFAVENYVAFHGH